jgi:hypothetical protein
LVQPRSAIFADSFYAAAGEAARRFSTKKRSFTAFQVQAAVPSLAGLRIKDNDKGHHHLPSRTAKTARPQ